MSAAETEYAVRCPDGVIWEDRSPDEADAAAWAVMGDKSCGCEKPGHVAVTRTLSPWEPVGRLPVGLRESLTLDAVTTPPPSDAASASVDRDRSEADR